MTGPLRPTIEQHTAASSPARPPFDDLLADDAYGSSDRSEEDDWLEQHPLPFPSTEADRAFLNCIGPEWNSGWNAEYVRRGQRESNAQSPPMTQEIPSQANSSPLESFAIPVSGLGNEYRQVAPDPTMRPPYRDVYADAHTSFMSGARSHPASQESPLVSPFLAHYTNTLQALSTPWTPSESGAYNTQRPAEDIQEVMPRIALEANRHMLVTRNFSLYADRALRNPISPRHRHMRSGSSQSSESPGQDQTLSNSFEGAAGEAGIVQYRKRRRATSPNAAAALINTYRARQQADETELNNRKCQTLLLLHMTNRLVLRDSSVTQGGGSGVDSTFVRQATASNRLMEESLYGGLLAFSSGQSPAFCLPRMNIGQRSHIFTSELFPRSFSLTKRDILSQIFRNQSFVPAAKQEIQGLPKPIIYYVTKRSSASRIGPIGPRNLPLGPGRRGWPTDSLPVEVFNTITSYLPRESLQAMRLVNAEFERKTSNKLFHTVVVPFRSEIYGMMTHQDESQAPSRSVRKGKGKQKAKLTLASADTADRTIHDGMKVFEAWGPHIRRFAMAFEVDETALEKAPKKGKFEQHTTWWGGYQWPHPYYNRYEACECLEKKADEFKCMSKALSYLQETMELGLSLDSGLGWLSGPDKSDRARLIEGKPELFGLGDVLQASKRQEAKHIWDDIVESVPRRYTNEGWLSEGEAIEVQVTLRSDTKQISFFDTASRSHHKPLIFEGVDLSAASSSSLNPEVQSRYAVEGLSALSKPDGGPYNKAVLKPAHLSIAQQEWLLETEWAQRAFLSSFCMALCDNAYTFRYVHTLNISNLSSRYLSALQRDDIWNALTQLSKLVLNVSPDWRNIMKTDTGLVEASDIRPSTASTHFFNLLVNSVAKVENIKSLTLGYTSGGEHQPGIFGRNKNILPAPIIDFLDPNAILQRTNRVLELPHVESLTLVNCWITPDLLKTFVAQLKTACLHHLQLRSVSLTAHTAALPQQDQGHASPRDSYDTPQGPPRRGDASVGNFFDMRVGHGLVPDPAQDGWVTKGQRVGSWGNVIDSITPGPTTDFIRYAFQYREERPETFSTNLERITFESCGYVCLPHYNNFNQQGIGKVVDQLPIYLVQRAVDLHPIMMARPNDHLLGQIAPTLKPEDIEVMCSAFPMRLGWGAASYDKAMENREDGQPKGGDGRFSGMVDKLVLPPID
ncbi:uncharacterized protein KY384_006474 [Bacidia gigantensis]|uniref:uncharacterized protein n=1 Tax=Bacidia gigantensis TaxID=2732470 RepID=UPI001D05201A|nr:uncharacterized protein KY384_006474 [Bacidia gigantensis]KAG8528786.1 hypothetical protein KY384_006474 [Bacidia gigantensis]